MRGLRRAAIVVMVVMVVVVVVVVIAVVADLVARSVAQNQLADRAQMATGAKSASATINSFPFLYRFLVDGEVSQVAIHLTDVPVGALRLSSVNVVADGTTIDRTVLFSGHKVEVLAMNSATATVVVTAAELTSAVGTTVQLPGGGAIEVEVEGALVPATVEVLPGDVLQVTAAGAVLLSSTLSQSPLVPACGLALSVGVGEMTVSCHVQPVPASVLAAISGAG